MYDWALTTIDNEFDPFTQPNDWEEFNRSHGYDPCAILDHFAPTSLELTDEENAEIIQNAMIEIVDLLPMYKVVIRKIS